MRLGFHYHVPAVARDRDIFMPAFQGRFIDSLAEYCTEVICFLHSPLGDDVSQMDYQLQRDNVRLIDLGPHNSTPRRVLSGSKYVDIIRKHRSLMDLLLIRGPSPLLPVIANGCRPLRTSLLLVGDAVAVAGDSRQPFPRALAIRLLWRWNRYQQNRVAQRSLTFVNSRQLLHEMQKFVPELLEIRTTTLTRADFFKRHDTCLERPIRLLYTGRMTRGKGLIEIVEAISQLVREGHDIKLDLVGWPEKGDDVLDEMKALAGSLGIADRLIFHGPKAAGPELYSFYQRSDIFVIASKTSEGFPRTIWEAMANSVPVVATRVGSIPQYIEEAGFLVKPNNVLELSSAFRTLIESPELRQRMIKKGYELSRSVTLEEQVSSMVHSIKSWYERDPSVRLCK